MSRIYITYFLDDNVLKEARKKECDKILFYKSRIKVEDVKSDLILINIDINDRKLINDIFHSNKNKLHKFYRVCPDFFQYKKVELLEAINKEFFWSNWENGLFDYARKIHVGPNDKVFYNKSLKNKNKKSITFFKLINRFLSGYKLKTPNQRKRNPPVGKKYGFYISSSFHLLYYSNLVNYLGSQNCLFITNQGVPLEKGMDTSQENFFTTSVFKPVNKISLNSLIKGLKYFSPNELNLLLRVRHQLIHQVEVNNFNFNSTLKTFFLIAQESSGFGNITATMGKRAGKVIVNSHNGIKAGDAFNSDNYFDIWCVWDERMKEVLHQQCFIPESQLKVVGHFMQDHIAEFKYSGRFDEFRRNGKKILSLFSIPRNLRYKMQVVESVIRFVEKNDKYQLIIRLHPSEKPEEWESFSLMDKEKFKLIVPTPQSFKQELYDQLSITNLSIVFASTVAIESAWFGVPSITYEEGPSSVLYCSDELSIFHVNNINDLIERMNFLLSSKLPLERVKGGVAKRIEGLLSEAGGF